MEEIKLKEPEEMPIIYSKRIESIEPDDISPSKRKINLYMLMTVSAFIFIIAFSFSDICFKTFSLGAEKLPAIVFEDYFGDAKKSESRLSEFVSRRLLGIGRDTLSKVPVFNPEPSSDEHFDASDTQNEKTPISADTVLETEGAVITEEPETDIYENDEKKYPVISMDLSQKQLGEYYIGNETGYAPNIKSLLESDKGIPAISENESGQPLVLIIHTHGTESYLAEGVDHYADSGGDISRTDDTSKNVVHIGKIIADILNEEGVRTLHCETMHDKESYQDSYSRAAETIKSYIAKYPSIKYVFDVHRDAIIKSDGSLVKAVTEIDGKAVAQVMTVVGSNYKGADFPDWEAHLSLALKLKKKLDEKYDSLSRPIYLRGAAYNQQYTPGSLLLEIGTSGNTLAEAERAAELVAKAIAKMILS